MMLGGKYLGTSIGPGYSGGSPGYVLMVVEKEEKIPMHKVSRVPDDLSIPNFMQVHLISPTKLQI